MSNVSMIDGHIDREEYPPLRHMSLDELNEYIDKGALYDTVWFFWEGKKSVSKKAVLELIDKAPAVDIINSLQAEIALFKQEHNEIDNFARNICKERMLNGKPVADFEDLQKYIEKQIAESIKEIANKTNEMITEIYNKHIFGNNDLEAEEKDAIINFSDDVTYGFNNLVKEMVGDEL